MLIYLMVYDKLLKKYVERMDEYKMICVLGIISFLDIETVLSKKNNKKKKK